MGNVKRIFQDWTGGLQWLELALGFHDALTTRGLKTNGQE
jgi:hypothetical protein